MICALARRRGALLVAAGSLLAGAASATIVDLAFDSQGRFAQQVSVPAGKFFEVCGPLPAGQRVAWQYSGTAPLDFNIHYHAGQAVHYPARLKQTASAQDQFTADEARDYCWMWTNRGTAAARLGLQLQRR